MNDQFLHNYRKPPSKELIERVCARLEIEQRKVETVKTTRFRPIALGGIALLLVVAFVLIFSPVVRAQVGSWVKQIGTILFIGASETYSPNLSEAIYPKKTATPPATPYNEGLMSLEDARAQLPFPIDLPTWVPDGIVLQPQVQVTYSEGLHIWVEIPYSGTSPEYNFSLNVIQRLDGNPGLFRIGEGVSQEVKVNGEPAALVKGIWKDGGKQWVDDQRTIQLWWAHNGQTYGLYAYGIPSDVLIKIAESIH